MMNWKKKRKRKRLDTEKEDLTEKHTSTGKQLTVMLGEVYSPLMA